MIPQMLKPWSVEENSASTSAGPMLMPPKRWSSTPSIPAALSG
jgi:hypothetical protein